MTLYSRRDQALARELRFDSSLRLADYATKIGMPKSTVHERLRFLRRDGVRFLSIVDFEKLGCSVQAIFIVPLSELNIEDVAINSAQLVRRGLVIVHGVFRNVGEAEAFARRAKTRKYYVVLQTHKCERFYSATALA